MDFPDVVPASAWLTFGYARCQFTSVRMPKSRITTLLRPYWQVLLIAFVALLAEGAMDLLEPWPLKIVFDNVIGSKKMPALLAHLVPDVAGQSKLAILEFAALAVIAIAITGAMASYTEKYLTTKVGQQVMHDLRHTLYHRMLLRRNWKRWPV